MSGTAPRFSTRAARHIALAAQGFADPAPARTVTRRHVSRVIDRVQVVQVDSVNVLSRSHYLPFFSRLGRYPLDLVDERRDRSAGAQRSRARAARGDLVEYWAHEASLVPVATWPWLSFRMRSPRWHPSKVALEADHPGLLDAVVDAVRTRGPLTSREIEAALPSAPRARRDSWGWNWSVVKQSLEYLFSVGTVSSAGRTAQFERRYAAAYDVVPSPVAGQGPWGTAAPADADCGVELMRIAARAHGIGTEVCLRDYFRLPPALARHGLAELIRLGEVEPVTIAGWDRPAYLWAQARRPRKVSGAALLSPFDSLIWQRERTERVFGFRYRLEIYVPAPKRIHGYYVLPFLLDGELVARVDLKADRVRSALRVPAVAYEPGAPTHTAQRLREQLNEMADWLGLDRVVMDDPGSEHG
ncbi:MAG: crosslink repair DNA glycosylase YcaQ family protein [Ornithinimicrobium sp.]